MTNKQSSTVEVSRERLQTLIDQCLGDNPANPDIILEEMRAILAAPVEQSTLQVPEECPHMIVFDDADREPLTFAGSGARQAALKTWEQVSRSWNAHLFVRIERNSRDDRYPSASAMPAEQQAEPVAYYAIETPRIVENGEVKEWTPGCIWFTPDKLLELIGPYRVTETLYRHAQPPATTGPWERLSAPGQIKSGDWLCFTVGGKFFCVQAREILNAGTDREEIIYNRSKNHYFVTSMAIEGTSSHKAVMVAKP